MTKIILPSDCGNAPRKQFLADFNAAFATGNAEFIIEHVTADIRWTIHGDKEIQGKEKFSAEVHGMTRHTADELTVHEIITHGRTAALNGQLTFQDKQYAFCDVYRFRNTKANEIVEMDSYVVAL